MINKIYVFIFLLTCGNLSSQSLFDSTDVIFRLGTSLPITPSHVTDGYNSNTLYSMHTSIAVGRRIKNKLSGMLELGISKSKFKFSSDEVQINNNGFPVVYTFYEEKIGLARLHLGLHLIQRFSNSNAFSIGLSVEQKLSQSRERTQPNFTEYSEFIYAGIDLKMPSLSYGLEFRYMQRVYKQLFMDASLTLNKLELRLPQEYVEIDYFLVPGLSLFYKI